MRPHDSLWDGAHDARLTGDVVDEILGGKVDRADWSVASANLIAVDQSFCMGRGRQQAV